MVIRTDTSLSLPPTTFEPPPFGLLPPLLGGGGDSGGGGVGLCPPFSLGGQYKNGGPQMGGSVFPSQGVRKGSDPWETMH